MKILKSICLIAAFQDFMRSDFSLSHLCTFYSLITVLHSQWKFSRPMLNYLLSFFLFISVSYSEHFLPSFWKVPAHFQFLVQKLFPLGRLLGLLQAGFSALPAYSPSPYGLFLRCSVPVGFSHPRVPFFLSCSSCCNCISIYSAIFLRCLSQAKHNSRQWECSSEQNIDSSLLCSVELDNE